MFINRSKTSENTQGSSTLATNQSLSTEVRYQQVAKFINRSQTSENIQGFSTEY